MNRQDVLIIIAAVMGLTACMPRQSVQGSYATPSKQIQGTALGLTAGAIVAPVISEATLLGATSTGAAAGNVQGAFTARHRLMNTLAERGVQVIAQGDKLRIILSTDRFYLRGVPKLNPEEYPTLDYLAALLKEYGKTPILIAGYTDNISSRQQAELRSRQRAESLLGYLWVHGIEYGHMKAVGYGPKHPIANNETVRGSAANRRIEITLRAGC